MATIKRNVPSIDDTDIELLEMLEEAQNAELALIPIEDLDEVPIMPLELVQRQKDILAEQKKRLMLQMDGKKLQESVKVLGGMESITDILTDVDVLKRVKENTKTAMDVKFLADAYGKLADNMKNLQRLDSVDGQGNAGRIMLQLQNSDGSSIKAMIESN